MISAFCSRAFGLGLTVTNEQLFEINKRRSEGLFSHYVSTESANEIYGTTLKKPFDSKELLVRYFEVGVMAEGYWNYHHIFTWIVNIAFENGRWSSRYGQ